MRPGFRMPGRFHRFVSTVHALDPFAASASFTSNTSATAKSRQSPFVTAHPKAKARTDENAVEKGAVQQGLEGDEQMIEIRDPTTADEAVWRVLWDGYLRFYKTSVPEE